MSSQEKPKLISADLKQVHVQGLTQRERKLSRMTEKEMSQGKKLSHPKLYCVHPRSSAKSKTIQEKKKTVVRILLHILEKKLEKLIKF